MQAVEQAAAFSKQVTLLASGARTVGANATPVTGLGLYRAAMIMLDVTALATDALDTLDVFIDTSPDGGTTWINAIHFTQLLGNGSAVKEWAELGGGAPAATTTDVMADAAAGVVRPMRFTDRLRVRYAIIDSGDANQSFTFSVKAYLKS